MTQEEKNKENPISHFVHHKLDLSAILTVIGIVLLFSTSIAVILIAPYFTETQWRQPTCDYQVQMYEVSDPNFYISSTGPGVLQERQMVHHLKQDFSLLAFKENESLKIITEPNLEKYVTHVSDKNLKLTSMLLLLREPEQDSEIGKKAEELQQNYRKSWKESHDNGEEKFMPALQILELYQPDAKEAFAQASTDGIFENWINQDFEIIDAPQQKYHSDSGVIFVTNPQEYRIRIYRFGGREYWRYDPQGSPIASLEDLKSLPLNFMSRQELIKAGEDIYSAEGCWYCHTDQTRTLVQDVVLNGSDSFPAPPSSPNEYIYQRVSFPGTRRIGPDLSRVGVKRPSRDWHKSHFWSPKTASAGTIMPAFKHFFDNDPSGVGTNRMGMTNFKFEAIFQYLMTKGTRITAPSQAWWLGKDPINTLDIIEGRKELR